MGWLRLRGLNGGRRCDGCRHSANPAACTEFPMLHRPSIFWQSGGRTVLGQANLGCYALTQEATAARWRNLAVLARLSKRF